MIDAHSIDDFNSWRINARNFLAAGIAPYEINWNSEQTHLFGNEKLIHLDSQKPNQSLNIPKEFFDIGPKIAASRYEEKWDLLYRIAYRIVKGEKNLLHLLTDNDIRQAKVIEKSVNRDIHKMHAFVRFKQIDYKGHEIYLAWHKPEHFITKLGAPFFARRFGDKPWSIFTPHDSAHWNLKSLQFGPGLLQKDFKLNDEFDNLWKLYYKSIFNPARIKIKAMKNEMPTKYWASMPETELIEELIREAPAKLQAMNQVKSLASPPPKINDINFNEEVNKCQACPLSKADKYSCTNKPKPNFYDVMIIVGSELDIPKYDLDAVKNHVINQGDHNLSPKSNEKFYLAYAIKHKAEKNLGIYMQACKPWLDLEIQLVRPKKLVVLGKTAAIAMLGFLPNFKNDHLKFFDVTMTDGTEYKVQYFSHA